MADQKPVVSLEQGSIYFFYRPRIGEGSPEGEEDIQRFLIVFSPVSASVYRLAVIGRKELPSPQESGRNRYWGYVSLVSDSPEAIRKELGPQEYTTKTRGKRQIGPARPAGEGVYRLLVHHDHTHLVYARELPERSGDVQHELHIEDQASYIITVKNPEANSPPNAGLPKRNSASYPPHLQKVFRGRRFSEVGSPDLLNYEGAEFILVSSSGNLEDELGIVLDTEKETAYSADVFTDLKVDRSRRPLEPLFTGEWK